ncbi:MAG: tetratricopeptide repeat protein [Candidatus Binatia bacterium]
MRTVVFAFAVLLAAGPAEHAAAQAQPPGEQQKADKEKGSRSGAAVDPATGKRLNEAVEALHKQRYPEARAALTKLDVDRLSPYERSRVEQLFAAIDQAEGRYASARDHLGKALASEGLNEQEASSVRFQIAQLFMAEDKWREGVEALKQWFATAQNPNSAAYHLLAVAYFQLGDHDAALGPAQKAIELAGGKPQETWLQLLLAIRLEREEYRLAVPLLEQLIEAAPTRKNYWLQLSAVNAQLGHFEQAGVPMQLAYYADLLTDGQDIQRLAELLLRNSIPYRAGKILGEAIDKGKIKADFKTYELLSTCWVMARDYEKAIPPLRRAAELSGDGELYVRLAEVYVQREDWANAAAMVRLALDKGKLKKPGNAHLLMGVALYNQKKPQEARTWFERAHAHAGTRSQAEGWLRHVETELES